MVDHLIILFDHLRVIVSHGRIQNLGFFIVHIIFLFTKGIIFQRIYIMDKLSLLSNWINTLNVFHDVFMDPNIVVVFLL